MHKLKGLFGYGIVLCVFILTLWVRSPYINRPLSAHHEWLTGLTLMVTTIWKEEGAIHFKFAPCVSFNQPRQLLAANHERLIGPDGRGYYLSHAPLTYLFPYLLAKILNVEVTPLLIQVMNLAFNLFCALLIYRLLSTELSSLPGVVGSVFYLLYPTTLWFQSNVYLNGAAVQPLWIAAVYLWLGLWRDVWEHNKQLPRWFIPRLALLALFIFLCAFTDYLIVSILAIMVVSHGLELLIKGRGFPASVLRMSRVSIVGVSLVAALAAYGLVFLLYSSQVGAENYLSSLHRAYLDHKGWGAQQNILAAVEQYPSFLGALLNGHLYNGHLREYMIALLTLSPLIFFPRKGAKDTAGLAVRVLLGYLIAPLLDLSLLKHSTLVHDMTVLKLSPAFALLSGIISYKIWDYLLNFTKKPEVIRINRGIFYLLIAFLLSAYAFFGFKRYHSSFASGGYADFKIAGKFIREKAEWQNKMLYAITRPGWLYGFDFPPLVYYMRRNFQWVVNFEHAKNDLRSRGVRSGVLLVWDDLRTLMGDIPLTPIPETRFSYLEFEIA